MEKIFYKSLYLLFLLFLAGMVSCKKEAKPELPANKNQVTQNTVLGNYWTQLAVPVINVPGPPPTDESNFSFSANDKLYVALIGYNQLWEYDPASSQWTLKQSSFFNFPLTSGDTKCVFTNGNGIYFLNGKTKILREYDLSIAQWSTKANFPGAGSTGLASAFTSTKGYVLSGANGSDNNGIAYTVAENWEYDFVMNTWTLKAATPGSARFNAAAYAIGDKVYFGTGISAQLLFNPITFTVRRILVTDADWWEYSTTGNSWTQKTPFGGGVRQDTRGFVIDGKLYLGMGSAGYFVDLRSDLWAYDPVANSWAQRAGYPPGAVYLPWFSMSGAAGLGFAINDDIQAFWSYTAPYTRIGPSLGSAVPIGQP